MTGDRQPDVGLGCAILSAIVVPVVLVALLMGFLVGDLLFFPAVALAALMLGLPIATVHVVMLALPLYLLLRDRFDLRWWIAAVAGLICGGLPVFIISEGGDELFAWFGGAGLAGGLAFHLTLQHERMRKGRPVAGPPFREAETFEP